MLAQSHASACVIKNIPSSSIVVVFFLLVLVRYHHSVETTQEGDLCHQQGRPVSVATMPRRMVPFYDGHFRSERTKDINSFSCSADNFFFQQQKDGGLATMVRQSKVHAGRRAFAQGGTDLGSVAAAAFEPRSSGVSSPAGAKTQLDQAQSKEVVEIGMTDARYGGDEVRTAQGRASKAHPISSLAGLQIPGAGPVAAARPKSTKRPSTSAATKSWPQFYAYPAPEFRITDSEPWVKQQALLGADLSPTAEFRRQKTDIQEEGIVHKRDGEREVKIVTTVSARATEIGQMRKQRNKSAARAKNQFRKIESAMKELRNGAMKFA